MLHEMNPRQSVKEVPWVRPAENLTWGLKWAMGYFTDAEHLWFPLKSLKTVDAQKQ